MDVKVGLSYEAAALELEVSLQSEARSEAPTLSDKDVDIQLGMSYESDGSKSPV